MRKIDSEKKALPFNDFLAYLKRQGFIIGVDHHLRLHTILKTVGETYPPSELKYLLCPVFANSEKQQKQFYRAFDSYFKPLPSSSEKDASASVVQEPPEPIRARKWPYVLLGLTLLILIGVFSYWQTNKPQLETEKPAIEKPVSSPESPAPTGGAEVKTENVQAPKPADTEVKGEGTQPSEPAAIQSPDTSEKPEPELSFYQRYWQTIRWLCILTPMIIFLLTEWYRFNRRKVVLQRQKGKKPPFVWPIQVETPALGFIKNEQFYSAARLMRQRLKSEVYQLDVGKTITRLISSGGFLRALCYSPLTKPAEYLMLIDLPAFRDHYARMADTLVSALENEDIIVTRYFYENNPRVCFRDVRQEREYLFDLEAKYGESRLIIFGKGEELLEPISGELENWTSRIFHTWRDRAILTPERPQNWGMREFTLAREFVLLPASLEGLSAIIEHFETSSKPDLKYWKQADSQESDVDADKLSDADELRNYLGDEVFQWLCACAVYPELHWDMTVYLGALPCMPEKLVNEEKLVRLIRLPWFREGRIPDELRWRLIGELDEGKTREIRAAIAVLLEKDPPPENSFAYDAFRLNLALQQWAISPKRLRDRRRLREILESVSESDMARDYTLLRFTESVPKSGVSLVLPGRIRRMFYRNGVFALGIKTGVRFAFTLFAVILLFMVTKSDTKLVEQTGMTPAPGPKSTTSVTTTVKPETPESPISNTIGMKLIYIPPGTFMMGSPPDEPGRFDAETLHEVTLTRGFYMQTTEVTVGQWKQFVADTGYAGDGKNYYECKGMGNPDGFSQDDSHPAVCVSWNEAREFAKWLNGKESTDRYRLPTEAEWEYACRAGTSTAYNWGDKADCSKMMYENDVGTSEDKCVEYVRQKGLSPDSIAPVMSYAPNSWGLYDMHGNVWEWCQVWYGKEYPSGSIIDPEGPSTGSGRVIRGGSWFSIARHCRSAYRPPASPGARDSNVGFRLLRTP